MDKTLITQPPQPPPINDLCSFSTALTEFIRRYDDLNTHITFIQSSIDSKLPHQFINRQHAAFSVTPVSTFLNNNNKPPVAVPAPAAAVEQQQRQQIVIVDEIDDDSSLNNCNNNSNKKKKKQNKRKKKKQKNNNNKKKSATVVGEEIDDYDRLNNVVEGGIDGNVNNNKLVVVEGIDENDRLNNECEGEGIDEDRLNNNKKKKCEGDEIDGGLNNKKLVVVEEVDEDRLKKKKKCEGIDEDRLKRKKKCEGIDEDRLKMKNNNNKKKKCEGEEIDGDRLKRKRKKKKCEGEGIDDEDRLKRKRKKKKCEGEGVDVEDRLNKKCEEEGVVGEGIVVWDGKGEETARRLLIETIREILEELDGYNKVEQQIDRFNGYGDVDMCDNNLQDIDDEEPEEEGNEVEEIDAWKGSREEIGCLRKEEESEMLNKHREIVIYKNPDVIDVSKKDEEISAFDNLREEISVLGKREETGILKKDDLSKKVEEESDRLNKHGDVEMCDNVEDIEEEEEPEEVEEEICNSKNLVEEIDASKIAIEENGILRKEVERGLWKKGEEINVSGKHEETDMLNKHEENGMDNNLEGIDVLKKHEETDRLNKYGDVDMYNNREDIDEEELEEGEIVVEIEEETQVEEVDISKNSTKKSKSENINKQEVEVNEDEETDVKAIEVVEIEDEENTEVEGVDVLKNSKEVVSKKPDNYRSPEEIAILKKPEEIVTCMNPEETEVVDIEEEEEETEVKEIKVVEVEIEEEEIKVKEPEVKEIEVVEMEIEEEEELNASTEEIGISKKHEETDKSKKSIISRLEFLCKNMSFKKVKVHVGAHFSQINQEEIAKALKLAKQPAKLVIGCIGKFYLTCSRSFIKGTTLDQFKIYVGRLASVLVLECFVMISGDGIEITKQEKEHAAKAAVDWKNRMIKDGGLGHTDEVDSRGLLLLISGFGIQDDVFTVQDILNLIRASNVKGISAALRHSVFLLQKIPEVIDLLVKNNEEIEAADIAYTFGLVDKCRLQNASSSQMPEAMKQQLSKVEEPEVKEMDPTEEIGILKKHEENGILKSGEETNVPMKHKVTKFIISSLEFICKNNMGGKRMKKHVVTHLSEIKHLHKEMAKALKLAKNPAKLVLDSIGRYYLESSNTFGKDTPHQITQNVLRQASVLILECFVMISSSDGIKIAKQETEYAAKAAVVWKNRMIRDGGLGHTVEVDARGLLLLISGFGIPDHIFTIQDILDLIRASNVKGISASLRCSGFLLQKLSEVIDWMVKNNLDVEAADIAYMLWYNKSHPHNILVNFLHKKSKDVQNASSSKMLEALKQQLFDVNSVKQCLESHNIDPSVLLPDFKLDEKIKNLEKAINEWALIQNRKPLENLIHLLIKKPEDIKDVEIEEEEPQVKDIKVVEPEVKKPEVKEIELVEMEIEEETEIDASKNPTEDTETSKKLIVSELEHLCKTMSCQKLTLHVGAHLSQINQEEIAKALKLAKNPAKLVLDSIGRFYLDWSMSFCKGNTLQQYRQYVGRLASILILECFVMISSSDGIEIAKQEKAYAAKAAVDWKNRMITESGLRHTDEVDARGLLLLISGFGIEDHVFRIPDIVNLIRVSNVKGIINALLRSVILLQKIPEVIDWLVKNNEEIEAADIAYTFGLVDKSNLRNILLTYLHKKVKDVQNTSFQMMEALKQHLFDLNAVKQCLVSNTIDVSLLLPDFKIDEKIQNLEKEINEWELMHKRKPLENPIHHESKRACISHENIPHQHNPVDHRGMNPYNRPTQHVGYFGPYTHPPSSAYNAPVIPGITPGMVPTSPAGGFPGSNQMVHQDHVRPYVQHAPYNPPPPYYRPQGWAPPEPVQPIPPSGHVHGRRGPTPDPYGFADIAEKESRSFHAHR